MDGCNGNGNGSSNGKVYASRPVPSLAKLARRLRRSMLVLFTALGLAATATAQDGSACPPVARPLTPEQVQQGLRDAQDRGFLWRISKNGRDSFLFGTVHLAQAGWMFPGPRLRRALNNIDTVAVELDMLDPAIQKALADGMAAGRQVNLPTPLQQRLDQQLAAACLPAGALERMAPEMQAITLTVLSARRDGLDPAWGIDTFLAGYARGAGKAVTSLETPALQIRTLQTGSEREALDLLDTTLRDLETGRTRQLIQRVAQVWAAADLEQLARYDSWCQCLDSEADRQRAHQWIDQRNPAIAERIDSMHGAGQRVFAAVGSLHMIGPQGLPRLMEQRGYQVQRIDFTPAQRDRTP
jgi:uncharacterized protein